MNSIFLVLLPLAVLYAPPDAVAGDQRLVTIFEGREISVPVPAGWNFEPKEDPQTGIQAVVLTDPAKEVSLSMSFIADGNGDMTTKKGIEKQARKVFSLYLEQSVEKEIRLEFFEAPGGLGVFSTFTDKNLDPKHIPEGEKLISTTGLRSWKGAYLLFTLLTNSTNSAAYKTALDIVRSGLKQVKAPASF